MKILRNFDELKQLFNYFKNDVEEKLEMIYELVLCETV